MPNTSSPAALNGESDQFAALSRQVAQLRWMMLIVPALFFLLGAAASETFQATEIKAKRFIVTGDDGEPRAVLAAVDDVGRLSVCDADGDVRVQLRGAADIGTPQVILLDKKQKTTLVLGENADNGVGFVEYHKSGAYKGGHGGNAFD